MAYVVFDLEWNQPYINDVSFLKKVKQNISGEIIQIGAVRLDEKFHVEDTFNVIIKPKFLMKMHSHVSKLTGITTADLQKGVNFSDAYKDFVAWCGEKPILFTWGIDDMQLLSQNIKLHRLDELFPHRWYDAQRMYAHMVHGTGEQISLMKAVEANQIEFDMNAHDALNDALYTFRVLEKIDWKCAIKEYDLIMASSPQIPSFTDELKFEIFGPVKDQLKGLEKKEVNEVFCPYCGHILHKTNIERLTNGKYLSLATCHIHGNFSVMWRTYKKYVKDKKIAYHISRSIFIGTKQAEAYYYEKAKINRLKEEKYLLMLKERALAENKK